MRVDGRRHDELRSISIIPEFVNYPEGSVLLAVGETKVLCNVTIEEGVPRWMQAQKVPGGWITAEYSLLPRSTHQRTPRETSGLRGRTQEIRRMIGRSLRAAFDLQAIGNRTCIVDCDVIQADGGTRTAAITGGYLSLVLAMRKLIKQGAVEPAVFKSPIAAVSVGLVGGLPALDLCYREDFEAGVDVNVVMNADGEFIEVQGTAEGEPFMRTQFDELLDLAQKGIFQLIQLGQTALA